MATPRLSLVTFPQVPLFSPVAINWIFSELYVLAMIKDS